MSTQYVPYLTNVEEDALHAERLMPNDDRPFNRLKKYFTDDNNKKLLRKFPGQLPTPPPDAENDDTTTTSEDLEAERALYRDGLDLEFDAFESFLIRCQLVKQSNEKERQRYSDEKHKIVESSQTVRDNIVDLRTHLVDAQRTLALRKEYDVLADKITSSRMLKPRDEQAANIEKLNAEIAELEAEGREFDNLWADRREQFNKIVEEGKTMMRIIRGEKDEEEEEEQENEEGEDGEVEGKADDSMVGTPRPETGAETPGRAPIDGEETTSSDALRLRKTAALGAVTPALASSTAASPAPHDTEGKDTEMGEAEAAVQTAANEDDGEIADEPAGGSEVMDTT